MTDDIDANEGTDESLNRTVDHTEDKHRDSGTEKPETDEPALSREEWQSLESNPDLWQDFDYRISDWERFTTLDGSDQVMFLPADEAELKEDAFVVAGAETLCDLGENC